ncbi:hypothetical protein [Marinomonas algicola]|nr:hypothetical protein [Marinomonas algicola]
MHLVPVVSNTRFHKQLHVNLAAVLHDLDDFDLKGVRSLKNNVNVSCILV